MFPETLWPLLAKTPIGAGNEIQLTDAMAMLLEQSPVNAYYMKGKSHDCGNKLGYAQAFIEHAMRHPALADDMKKYIKQLQANAWCRLSLSKQISLSRAKRAGFHIIRLALSGVSQDKVRQ